MQTLMSRFVSRFMIYITPKIKNGPVQLSHILGVGILAKQLFLYSMEHRCWWKTLFTE